MLPVGTILKERYHLQEQGPAQDLGTLYYAHDAQMDRPLDILVMRLSGPMQDRILEGLMQVQRRVASLGQPGLVPYEYAGSADGLLYLVRPRVEGHTLVRLLASAGALKPRAAVEIAIRLCETLAAAHHAGLIHGGLSPHCLFLREGAQGENGPRLEVVITDLGLLPALRPALAAPGQLWGRWPYLSPEQAAGQRILPASDVYVIGSLIYLMLTGRPPFRAGEERVLAMQLLRQDPPSLQILAPDVPEPLAQIVHQSLAKEPAARYRHAGQLAHILRTPFGPQPLLEPSPPAAERRQPAVQAPPGRAVSPLPHPVGGLDRPGAGERMMVPPPPRRRPIWREYEPVEDAAWVEEPAGADWLMWGLLALAIVAVLGLIPLWRTVHARYSAPPQIPTPAAVAPLPQEGAAGMGCLSDSSAQGPVPGAILTAGSELPTERKYTPGMPLPGPELEKPGVFWYNSGSTGANLVPAKHRPAGVHENYAVWESSLRASRPKYCKLEPGHRWPGFFEM